MNCRICGAPLPSKAKFCRACGATVSAGNSPFGANSGFESSNFGSSPFESSNSGNQNFGSSDFGADSGFGKSPFGGDSNVPRQPFGSKDNVGSAPFGEGSGFGKSPFGSEPGFGSSLPPDDSGFGNASPSSHSGFGSSPFVVDSGFGNYDQYASDKDETGAGSRNRATKKYMPAWLISVLVGVLVLVIGITTISMLSQSGQSPAFATETATTSADTINDGTQDNSTAVPSDAVTALTTATVPPQSGDIFYTYQTTDPEPVFLFETVDEIYPSLYRSLDYIATFTGTCENGEKDIIIKLVVPGFTQQFEQKLRLTRQITKLRIVPPLVTGELNLGSDKAAQIQYSVTDAATGKLIDTQSKNITIYSKYDMVWWTQEYQDAARDNILAWLTPESARILQLQRDASDYLSQITNGAISGIIGYQDYGYFDREYENTAYQAVAIQGALSDIANVRYIMSTFSIANAGAQRVKLPDDVLESKSGLCIETCLVMASALQAAGMHVMLIFPPGHAQVAVEAWPDSGDYYLIETTILPMSPTKSGFDSAVVYMDKEQWAGYLDGSSENSTGECYVLDCDLGQKLGIKPITN